MNVPKTSTNQAPADSGSEHSDEELGDLHLSAAYVEAALKELAQAGDVANAGDGWFAPQRLDDGGGA